jgi:hypothetical protein
MPRASSKIWLLSGFAVLPVTTISLPLACASAGAGD